MSLTAIRGALETAIFAMSPALETATENNAYVPKKGTPYQRLTMIMAAPDDREIGGRHLEIGFLQVDLCYPQAKGPGDAAERAGLLKTTFRRGLTFSQDGVSVLIGQTPQVLAAYVEGDRYILPVRVFFRAEVND